MPLTSAWQVFAVGTLGGLLLELFHWYALRREARLPDYAYSLFYWTLSALMALVGGILAWIYFGSKADGIVALHVGISSPLILQKLVSTLAQVPGARGRSWISFFSW